MHASKLKAIALTHQTQNQCMHTPKLIHPRTHTPVTTKQIAHKTKEKSKLKTIARTHRNNNRLYTNTKTNLTLHARIKTKPNCIHKRKPKPIARTHQTATNYTRVPKPIDRCTHARTKTKVNCTHAPVTININYMHGPKPKAIARAH
jgi:hypothetical protein